MTGDGAGETGAPPIDQTCEALSAAVPLISVPTRALILTDLRYVAGEIELSDAERTMLTSELRRRGVDQDTGTGAR